MSDYGNVRGYLSVVEALIKGLGYTPTAARNKVDTFADLVIAEHSDHAAYRKLADHMTAFIGNVWPDPNDADGDSSELGLLCDFLDLAGAWLPDLIRHQAADAIRTSDSLRDFTDDHMGDCEAAAHEIDPFRKSDDGDWFRKSDGAPVPWQVLND
jgi:hypothetical protein